MGVAILAMLFAIPLLGALTGLRTMTPMAVLCWFAYLGHLPVQDTWAFWCAKLVTVVVFTVLAAGELVGDKLPKTPDRISAFPLIARVCFGGLVGALAATGLHASAVEGIILGSLSALGGAFVGFFIRRLLVEEKNNPDMVVAICEDGLAIVLSIVAMRVITA